MSSPVTHLRYVALADPDFEAATAFYGGIWGLTPVADDTDLAFFTAEGTSEPYIIRLRRAEEKRLDVVAFGMADEASVDALATRLGQAGTQLVTEPATLHTPGGGYGFRFFDPEGRLLEVSSDVAERTPRQLEARESIPNRLSHVVFNSTDLTTSIAFYQEHLGFQTSDWLEDKMCFLRCQTHHHSIAIAEGAHPSLNHVSFEMRGIDEFMRGTGRLIQDGGQRPLWGPGRHGAGDNTFSYFTDPNGNTVEYTTELEHIPQDAQWEPKVWTFDNVDQWGTAGPITEAMLMASTLNAPDHGLWKPAPV